MADTVDPQNPTQGSGGAQPGADGLEGTTVLTGKSDPGAGESGKSEGEGKGADAAGAGGGGSKVEGEGGGEAGPNAKTDDADPDGKKSEGPPEKYEFALPEGVTLDEGAYQAFEPVFRELGLSNAQAQRLAEKFLELRNSEAQALEQSYQQQAESWGKQTREDPEIGGAEFDKNIVAAQRAIAAFASDDFKALLNTTGLGNHPELVKFCVRIGKALGEDKVVGTGSPGGGQRSIAERLYPTMNP